LIHPVSAKTGDRYASGLDKLPSNDTNDLDWFLTNLELFNDILYLLELKRDSEVIGISVDVRRFSYEKLQQETSADWRNYELVC